MSHREEKLEPGDCGNSSAEAASDTSTNRTPKESRGDKMRAGRAMLRNVCALWNPGDEGEIGSIERICVHDHSPRGRSLD